MVVAQRRLATVARPPHFHDGDSSIARRVRQSDDPIPQVGEDIRGSSGDKAAPTTVDDETFSFLFLLYL